MQNKPYIPDSRRLTADYCHSAPREEAREGYFHLFNNPHPNLFHNRRGRGNVMGRCKHKEPVALVPTNRDFSQLNKSMWALGMKADGLLWFRHFIMTSVLCFARLEQIKYLSSSHEKISIR